MSLFVDIGEAIPFWYKTSDHGTPNFVVARVTDQGGNELSPSPYVLTPNGSGIFTGTGPIMNSARRKVYYQAYVDSLLTTYDRRYLDSDEWVQPTPGSSSSAKIIFVSIPLKGRVSNPVLKGVIRPIPVLKGKVTRTITRGRVSTPKLIGRCSVPEIEG